MTARERGRVEDIAARAERARRQIERRRFAGEDPVVDLSPRLGKADIVARVLAAERAGALLALDGARFNPREDLAEVALRAAIGALRGWSFAAARGRLDEAGERAHDPALQQRVALFKALTRLLSALIYTPLEEKPRGGLGDLDGVIAGLDRLTAEERLHYRDEADRLLNLRETAAGGDPFLAAAWTLIRARLALAAGQDEAAIVWLLHLAARHVPAATAPPGGAEGYLGTLLGRARAHLLARIGVADPAGPEDGTALAKNGAPHPRELSNALVAHLSDAFGRDLARGTELFALNEYVAADG